MAVGCPGFYDRARIKIKIYTAIKIKICAKREQSLPKRTSPSCLVRNPSPVRALATPPENCHLLHPAMAFASGTLDASGVAPPTKGALAEGDADEMHEGFVADAVEAKQMARVGQLVELHREIK